MNTIILTGRITKKPILKNTKGGKSVCEFSIAVNRKDKNQADFINCVVYGVVAENLAKYQDKGSQISVLGALRVDKYIDGNGNNKYKTYVLVNNIEFLGNKPKEDPDQIYKDFGESLEYEEEAF